MLLFNKIIEEKKAAQNAGPIFQQPTETNILPQLNIPTYQQPVTTTGSNTNILLIGGIILAAILIFKK